VTEKLRLGPLTRSEVVRLTVVLPASVKADLDRYAELFGATYGQAVEAVTLVPHMLAAFMERDRGFQRARQERKLPPDGSSPPPAMTDATSSANEIPSDASSSR